jgi:hypothetical protein
MNYCDNRITSTNVVLSNWNDATNISASPNVYPAQNYSVNSYALPENPDEKKTTKDIQRDLLRATLFRFNREQVTRHPVRSRLATWGDLRAIVRPEFHARSNPRGLYGGQVKKAGGLCRRKEGKR